MSNRIIQALAVTAVIAIALLFTFDRIRFATTSTLGEVLTENGFVELRPPSNLVAPGTWVEVIRANPLHLAIICGASDALGLADGGGVTQSESANLASNSKFNGTFKLDFGSILSTKPDLKYIRSVEFKLSNVRLLEIPDSIVFEGFNHRMPHCKEAIEYRLKSENPVSMIKSVLNADVEYFVEFQEGLDASIRQATLGKLASELGATAKLDQASDIKVTGASLVWGVRDDTALARYGYEVPQKSRSGNESASRSLLIGQGPITSIQPAHLPDNAASK